MNKTKVVAMADGDPRLNAVASLKPMKEEPDLDQMVEVIHGLMPWPH